MVLGCPCFLRGVCLLRLGGGKGEGGMGWVQEEGIGGCGVGGMGRRGVVVSNLHGQRGGSQRFGGWCGGGWG